jgi:hypothetical protein
MRISQCDVWFPLSMTEKNMTQMQDNTSCLFQDNYRLTGSQHLKEIAPSNLPHLLLHNEHTWLFEKRCTLYYMMVA